MKKYFSIVNANTFLVLFVSLASSFICYRFNLTLNVDFVVLEIVIAFPLAFSLRAAFRRREVAIRFLSLFKASLQAVVYAISDSKIDELRKSEFRNIVNFLSDELIEYLAKNRHDAGKVQNASQLIYTFVNIHRSNIKSRARLKISLFTFRINQSIEFLLATRRHSIPWGPKQIVLTAIYIFVVIYPAASLYDSQTALGSLFAVTSIKGLFLISFYNILIMLEDPFNQKSPDGIRLYDFRPVFDRNITPEISAVQPV